MRLLVAVLLLVAGAATGLATVAVHELAWGLPLAIGATVAALGALPPGWWSRLAFALGWSALVGWLSVPRPEGGFVIGSDVPGYTVLGLGLAVMVGGVATLPRPGSRRRRVPPESAAPVA